MKKLNNSSPSIVKTPGPADIEEGYFQPLQVVVNGNYERSIKSFKQLVQAERILSIYKEHQSYEKPSVKKRRKAAEAESRRFQEEQKQKKIASGEYERDKMRKQSRKEKRLQTRDDKTENEKIDE